MQKLKRNKGKRFEWNEEAQVAFENINRELCEVPVLGMPTGKGMYVLDTDASVIAISGILHQEQEWNGRTVLRPIAYGNKVLSDTEMKCGAPKAEREVTRDDPEWTAAVASPTVREKIKVKPSRRQHKK